MNNLVILRNERAVTTSILVADFFHKRHDHVLRDIDALEKNAPNFGEMFFESTREDSYGRLQRMFFMNRDGFSLLAMGFTGADALKWKIDYIKAFNSMEEELNKPEQIMARALKIADETIHNLTGEVKALTEKIEEMQPKITYLDKILESKDTMLVTQIAQDYGMSARGFNKMLHDLCVQHKVGGQWILYSKYQGNGYVHSRTHSYEKEDGKTGTRENTEWTQKGRLFLYDFLKSHNKLPLIEQED